VQGKIDVIVNQNEFKGYLFTDKIVCLFSEVNHVDNRQDYQCNKKEGRKKLFKYVFINEFYHADS
jgi:hypothetical protein